MIPEEGPRRASQSMAYITIIIITAKATLGSSTTVHGAYYSLLKTDFFTEIASSLLRFTAAAAVKPHKLEACEIQVTPLPPVYDGRRWARA